MLNVYADSSDDSDNDVMDALDMEHYRMQLERIFRSHRLHELPGAVPPQRQTLMDHRCPYCDARAVCFVAHPESKFRCLSLKQKILLNFGHQLYDNHRMAESLIQYPLPVDLKSNIRQVVVEMKEWLTENERFEETSRSGSGLSLFRCYLKDLHWIPGTVTIDKKATARMILQASSNFAFAGNVYRPGACEFLLAASNCLEDHINRLWPLLDIRVREQWMAADMVHNNPIISYWVAKCSGNLRTIGSSLERIVIYAIERDNLETLQYFWPKIAEALPNKLTYLYDHTFHTTIERGNRAAMYFVWYQAPVVNRTSMISSANCCGTRNAYHAFSMAVVHGLDDVVSFLWGQTSDEQHNGMLLADHSSAFCTAASKGYSMIVDLLWSNATKNQRFVLLYEGNCAAFRDACTEGHLNVVKILWASSDSQQRRQLLTVGQNVAFLSTCSHGNLNVLQYLFETMDESLMNFLLDSTLSRCLTLASNKRHKNVIEFFKSRSSILQYKRSIFSDDLEPLKAMLMNAADDVGSSCETFTASSDLDVENFWLSEAKNLISSLNSKQSEIILSKLPWSQLILVAPNRVRSNSAITDRSTDHEPMDDSDLSYEDTSAILFYDDDHN